MGKTQMPSAKFTTDVGEALYPHIHAKDARFAKKPSDAKYKCGIVLKGPSAKRLLKEAKRLIKEAKDKGLASDQTKLPGKWDKATETLTLKQCASQYAPALFDASGKPMPEGTRIGGGSKVKLALNLVVYEGFGNTGVTLYLQAVQVIEMIEGGGGDADSFGFDATEGFSYEDEGEGYGFGDEGGDDEDDSESDDDEFDGADF